MKSGENAAVAHIAATRDRVLQHRCADAIYACYVEPGASATDDRRLEFQTHDRRGLRPSRQPSM